MVRAIELNSALPSRKAEDRLTSRLPVLEIVLNQGLMLEMPGIPDVVVET